LQEALQLFSFHETQPAGREKMRNKEDEEKTGQCQCRRGFTRRCFLTSVGVGAMAALATTGKLSSANPSLTQAKLF